MARTFEQIMTQMREEQKHMNLPASEIAAWEDHAIDAALAEAAQKRQEIEEGPYSRDYQLLMDWIDWSHEHSDRDYNRPRGDCVLEFLTERGSQSISKERASLLNRAAAALETPGDLTEEEKQHVIEDLVLAAKEV